MLYWKIGKRIRQEVLQNQRAEYGEQIVSTPIGILCIIVGLTGVTLAHFQRLFARSGQLALEGLPEIPAGLVPWLTNLAYAALTISILFKMLPLFFLNH